MGHSRRSRAALSSDRPADGHGVAYTYGYFSPKNLGAGPFYLITIKDKEGRSFDGRNTYRLSVPANAPVTLYWSASAYDRATHALIRDMQWSSRSSLTPGLQKNADGSVDVYFGPTAPSGEERNWVQTWLGKGWFAGMRLYGPLEPFYDETWRPGEIELQK